MFDPRRLTTLLASTASYRDSFILLNYKDQLAIVQEVVPLGAKLNVFSVTVGKKKM
jgi:hypothetical protein